MPWLPLFPKSSANARKLRQHSADAVRRHQKLVENDPNNSGKATLFSKLYKAREDESLSFEEIRDHAQIYLTAGTSTTAGTLTYLVWAVCRQERIRSKLVASLRAHLASQGLEDDFQYDNIKGLAYLECVIKETLRLYPAVPHGMPRVVPAGGATLGGYHLPEGTNVAAQAYSLHRNREVWTNAEEFVPERWEEPTKAMRDSFLPWGGGSRSSYCPFLATILAKLFHEDHLETFSGSTSVTDNFFLYLKRLSRPAPCQHAASACHCALLPRFPRGIGLEQGRNDRPGHGYQNSNSLVATRQEVSHQTLLMGRRLGGSAGGWVSGTAGGQGARGLGGIEPIILHGFLRMTQPRNMERGHTCFSRN